MRIGPTVMDVLVLLAAHPGDTVTREDILETVWSGSFVTDEVLTNAVWELRRALGDDKKSPRYIQTVPRKGYRLLAPVGPPLPRVPTWKWKWLTVPAVILVALGLWKSWPEKPPPIPSSVRITTRDGREHSPALSPDGRRIAFLTMLDLHVVSSDGGDPLVVSSVGADGYLGNAAWSPDGEWIAFTRWGMYDQHAEIRMVRALGGSERHVATTYTTFVEIDWSPDGEWIAASGAEAGEETEAIYLYSVERNARRKLTSPPDGFSDAKPRFSPGGTNVAFIRHDRALMESTSDIYVQSMSRTAVARRVTSAGVRIDSVDWLPKERGFVAAAKERLFYVPLDSGELIPLEFADEVRDVWTEGERLVYRTGTFDTDIWRLPGPSSEPGDELAPWITSRSTEILPRYSPDGRRVLFTSDRSGSWQLWVCDAEARDTNCRQLTFMNENVGAAWWSPDGQQVAFVGAFDTPTPALYIVGADGGTPERLTPEDQPSGEPSWSHDGESLYFDGCCEDPRELWALSLPSRTSSRVGSTSGYRPIPSDDGRFLYYAKTRNATSIARIPLAGGDEELVLENGPGRFEWDLWGNYLVYLLWDLPYVVEMLDLDTRETTHIATLPSDYQPKMGLSVSPDGRSILLTRDRDEWDIVLVDDYISAIPR